MKTESRRTSNTRAFHALRPLACTLVLFIVTTGLAAQPPWSGGPPGSQNPAAFDAFIVAMIDTVIVPADMVLDGEIFLQDILGMTQAEADTFEAEAVAFFDERFGVDATIRGSC